MAQKPINLTLQAFSDHSGIGGPIHTIHPDAAGQDFSLSTLLVHPWYDSEPDQVLEICNNQDWHYDAVVELGRKRANKAGTGEKRKLGYDLSGRRPGEGARKRRRAGMSTRLVTMVLCTLGVQVVRRDHPKPQTLFKP